MRDFRAAVSEAATFAAAAPWLRVARGGDGHSVLVLPGWGADDESTRSLRWYLSTLGYRVHGWGTGRRNVGVTASATVRVTRRLEQLADERGRKVSVVGWSLGGVFARALARRNPEAVRVVVTLGSPLLEHAEGTMPVPVPCTSIYSCTDPIAPYRLSLLEPGPSCENIEVRGSHVGLGRNPAALLVIADRLAQPEGGWEPFRPTPNVSHLYPTRQFRAA